MTIKEVCEKYNLTPDTLRYYERVGVIPEVTRTAGGIRDYQDETMEARANLLKEARAQIVEAKKKYDTALEKLDYKIGRYEIAHKTGKLTWE